MKGESKKLKVKAFAMSLTAGFFYNAARAMINAPQNYIVIHEGTIVTLDPASVYSIKEHYPNYVIFTELSGTSIARGMMRQVSEIEVEWIEGYAELIKHLDI